MSYNLVAVVAASSVFEPIPAWLYGSKVVSLKQGISMIPITKALSHHVATPPRPTLGDEFSLFYSLPPHLVAHCEKLSENGMIAYIEAEFFGGTGEQHCVVWKNGSVIFGPLDNQTAINQALHLLGVTAHGFFDEFDAIDLGQHRETQEWVDKDQQQEDD